MTSPFRGGELRRVMRFYQNSPRIDFVVETNDLPDGTIVTAEFPLGGQVLKLRRGIPYGFAQSKWSQLPPERRGNNNGILPVIRWSHYTLEDGLGVGLLDRGVPGRELVDHTAIILLHNTVDYFGPDTMTGWMSGQGKQRYEYALIAHQTPWEQARIPQHAWEYNAPPLMAAGVELRDGKSYVETSENVIVEALRRTGNEIEIRLVECNGVGGRAMVKVNLPHQGAALTNLLGHTPIPLEPANSARTQGAEYHFDIRPQQIVTLRLKTREAVAPVEALTTFAPLIPEYKRHYTLSYHHPELVGCPKFKRIPTPVWKAIE
jgi:alpha-mannosidase